jgi:hypothetical protein
MVLPWVSFGSTFGCPAGGNSVLLPMIVSFFERLQGDNRRRRLRHVFLLFAILVHGGSRLIEYAASKDRRMIRIILQIAKSADGSVFNPSSRRVFCLGSRQNVIEC